MQFIHLGRRTGTLSVARGEERAEINFHLGAIVGARSPTSKRIGELLVEEGLLAREQVDEALAAQEREGPHRSLGQILLASGLLSVEDVREAIRAQIERTIFELVAWAHGSFVFELDTLKPVDDIAVYPGDIIPDIDLNTQMVLLEAARIFDERNRDEAAPDVPPPPPRLEARRSPPSGDMPAPAKAAQAAELFDETHPRLAASRASPAETGAGETGAGEAGGGAAPAAAPPREGSPSPPPRPLLQLVVGADDELALAVEHLLHEDLRVSVERVEPSEAGEIDGREVAPIVAFELRPGETSMDQLEQICRRRPGLPVICILDDVAATARAYTAGAAAVVPRDPAAVLGCFRSMTRFRALAEQPRDDQATRSAFAKLRRVVADLRSGVFSATVALNLMNVIAESVERAVLFLVKRDSISALGAFGFGPSGRPLAEATRSLALPLGGDDGLSRAVADGRTITTTFGEARLPDGLRELLGPPRRDQVVVFPVLGSDRVILVIYTDNGPLDQPIEEIDMLDLAAAEVGIAFENEMLRRQLSERG